MIQQRSLVNNLDASVPRKQAEDSPPSKTRIPIHIDHMSIIGDCWDVIFSKSIKISL